MRRVLAVVLALVATVGLSAPAFAQAPAPKVTITGLFDFVTNQYKNWSHAGACAAAGPCPGADVTDGGKDEAWYSRERGVFTITGEVGKSKAVWAIELDFTNGAGAANGGNAFNGGANGVAASGTSANFDLDTDVASVVETKWLYVETPIWGPGSMMPFIPVPAIIRAGAQPARGHEYKNGILLGGDIPGVTLETTWAPNVRSTVTYVQIGEALDKVQAAGQTEDFAILASVEWEVFKGLTIKPTYAYAFYDGGNSGTSNLGTEPKDGFNFNGTNLDTRRHTFGGDVRWTLGGLTIQPTVLGQLGNQEIRTATGGKDEVDIATVIVDTTVGYRIGPLNIEARGMWTPGMKASEHAVAGDDINYYQAINPAFGYMAGWTEIQTSGVDYSSALLAPATGLSLRQSPSYDKYGRIFIGLAADYSLTPALTLHLLGNASWTSEEVDTDSVLTASGLTGGDGRGDDRYLGVELNAGVTYRFAPNVALDLMGAYMFAGDALNHARSAGGGCSDRDNSSGGAACTAEDIYKAVARVRFTF